MNSEDDIYLGIEYFPIANKFRAATGWGMRARVIGYFDSLEEACAATRNARDAANKKGYRD